MALSAEDTQTASAIWEKIYADVEDNGADVLSRMFKEHHHTVSYFKNFTQLQSVAETASAEEIAVLAEVQAHGKKVFSALNDMVPHLNNVDALKETIAPLAKKHAAELKVDVKDFRIIFDNLLALIGEKQGADAKAAFKKVTDLIYEEIKAAY
ncbi:hemoglobin larval subunit beta-1-like isoform X1 [Protopterus annectens]|uniref:hemoglobin larval subunit beta-1-like isoform X1 n=1 Tax=Protopterus annectens TaxID=7888 RepID=UPI001CFBD47E|nr:hemoglobin larval subunit beta-1-like isoform X1 [Protopterus annectens]